jgi:hypothetical protein
MIDMLCSEIRVVLHFQMSYNTQLAYGMTQKEDQSYFLCVVMNDTDDCVNRPLIAQSFSPFSARDGRQVRRPSWIWATSLCYILLNKFVALVGSGNELVTHLMTKKD